MTRFTETAKINPVLAQGLEEVRPFHRDPGSSGSGRAAAAVAAVAMRSALAKLSAELRAARG